MTRPARRWTVCALAGALAALVPGSGSAQEKRDPSKANQLKVDPKAQRASGVIIKAEPVAKSGAEPRPAVRLTINTAAVWQDWARDQVVASPDESPRKAAQRGANSVATKGEPETKDTLVVIQLIPDGKVETRFRTLDGETSKGASTPAARESSARPSEGTSGAKPHAGKPVQYTISDLKPGLFVEADFGRTGGANQASSITVIRPVGSFVGKKTAAGK